MTLLAMVSLLSAQVDQSEMQETIDSEKLEHPYLLFDKDSKQEMLQRVNSDPHAKAIHERLLMEAYRYLKMPVYDQIPAMGDESRYFSTGDWRRFTGEHIEAALNLAFAYQLTGEQVYAEKAFQHAEMLCRLESWVYPFHEFPQIYDRVWPWYVDDDQVVFSYDLQSARIATHLALVYDWTYTAISKDQRNRIRGALLEKAITRVRGNFDYHWWASAYRCNWSGICYSGAGFASLALLKEDPQLMDVVSTAYNGVSSMLDELGPDGGWQEGRGYWAYGLGHSMWFMDAVKRASQGEYNLFKHARLKDNPADYPLYTLPANFGDGRNGPVGSSYFINKLAAETGDPTAAWYSQAFLRQSETIYDLIYPKSAVEAVEPEIKSKHFRGIDWAILRSSFKAGESFTLACKAGLNDDPHHGHLDCGQFILSYGGEYLIKDLGSAKYDDFYFSAERWDYIEASSKGHNVLFVNGEEQIPAKLKDQAWKEDVGGRIGNFATSDTRDYLSMTGLQKAYPGVEMKTWQRQIILEKPSLAIVMDQVGAEAGAEIRSRIHPGGKFEIYDAYYTIESSGQKIVVVPFTDQKLRIESRRHGSITVNDNVDFEWVPYVDCVIDAKNSQSISGYVIFPYNGPEQTEKMISTLGIQKEKNGDVVLAFDLAGARFEELFPGN